MKKLNLLATVSVAIACVLADTGKTIAHEWYPMECCSGQDCTEAKVYPRDDGLLMSATYPNGTSVTILVPHGFKWRASPDGKWHICVVSGNVQCAFRPTEANLLDGQRQAGLRAD